MAAADLPSLAELGEWNKPKIVPRTGKKAQAARVASLEKEFYRLLNEEETSRSQAFTNANEEKSRLMEKCVLEGQKMRKNEWHRPLSVEDIDCSLCFCPFEDKDAPIFGCCNLETPHYMDSECFRHALSTLSQDAAAVAHWEEHKALKCMTCDESILEASVFSSGDAACIKAYTEATRQIACTAERLEAQREAEKIAMADSQDAKKVLVKRMLTEMDVVMTTAISCPHCMAPFFDFNGCLALTCESCGKEFCGVCCRKHGDLTDGHAMVQNCTSQLTAEQRNTYGFHGTYFIGAEGWSLWREKLKTEGLYEYLRTLRVEFVWEFFHLIQKKLKDDQLLGDADVVKLKGMVFSHKKGENLHLVRLPNTFWLVYSAKNNVRFIEAVQSVSLTSDHLIRMGKLVVDRIRAKHPNWEPVRKGVPGETFQSINYPPEFLPLIAMVVEEWGKREGFWN